MLRKGFSPGMKTKAFRFLTIADAPSYELYSLIKHILSSELGKDNKFKDQYAFLLTHNAEFESFRNSHTKHYEIWAAFPEDSDRALWTLYYE